MSPSTPWDDLCALLPPPSTLRPTPADLSAQLPSHFIHVLHSLRSVSSTPSPPLPVAPLPPTTEAAAAAALSELLLHFRHLLASHVGLRAALAGRTTHETLWVSDRHARIALALLPDRLRHLSSLRPEERATWLAAMEIGEELVNSGGDSARHASHTVRHVFETVKHALERVKADAHIEGEGGE